MSITLLQSPAEIERLTELDRAECRRLCDPVAIARSFAVLARIEADMKALRAKRAIRKAVRPFVLPGTQAA